MSETADITINVRAKAQDRDLIDQAAALSGSNRSRFILEASRRAATEVLADRARLAVEPDLYAAFLARLDAAPAPNDRLRRTLTSPAPWDKA
jgi:uncharacterized protein (DUF1778 family)